MKRALLMAAWLTGCGGASTEDDVMASTTLPGSTSTSTSGSDSTSTSGSISTSGSSGTEAGESTSEAAESSTTGAGTEGSTTDGCVPFTPWFYASFDDRAVGERLTDGAPFEAAGRTVVTDAQAFGGGQAAQMEILPEDNGGFGQWGGIVRMPDVPEDASVWVRLWVRWPEGFEFSASPWMKFLRLHNRTASGDNGGYNDLYVDNAEGPESVLRVIKETHDIWEVYDGDPIPRETWERYEMQIVVDDVSVDDGGQGRFRVWRDDQLIFDRTDVPTVTGPGGVLDGLYIFTYWNNEAPPHNVAYIDELAISIDEPPPHTDASGLPVFGDWLPCP